MLTFLADLLDLLLVLGTSVWGWLGVAGGFGAAFLAWSVIENAELVTLVAHRFGVSKAAVTVKSGAGARLELVSMATE